VKITKEDLPRIVEVANSACDFAYFSVEEASIHGGGDGDEVTLSASIDGFHCDAIAAAFTDADFIYSSDGCESCGYGASVTLRIKEI
jgi:hypothetical protein